MGKVIFTIFAGRERYLKILNKYTDALLDRKIIDEVHFWAFTSNKDDILYMKNKLNDRYKLFEPPEPNKHIWAYYYQHYLHHLQDDDILIKCDDDIVYIDLDKYGQFLNRVNNDGLYFPNIVNNDVCAYLQTKYNVHNLFD